MEGDRAAIEEPFMTIDVTVDVTIDDGRWPIADRRSLPAKHPFPPPLRPFEHVFPFRVLALVSKRATDLIEDGQVVVGALEVGDEIEFALALVAVGVVIELAEDGLDSGFRRLRVSFHGIAGRVFLMRIEI